jgi:hypothetical protein
VVRQRQPAQPQRTVGTFDRPFGRRRAGAFVMVAGHQRQLQLAVRLAPLRHRGPGLGVAAARRMQQVAQEHDAPRTGRRHGGAQPVQGFAGGAPRHRHAEAAERLRLADVRVSHQQRLVFGQEGCALRQQPQPRAAGLDFDHRRAISWSGAAARVRCVQSAIS